MAIPINPPNTAQLLSTTNSRNIIGNSPLIVRGTVFR